MAKESESNNDELKKRTRKKPLKILIGVFKLFLWTGLIVSVLAMAGAFAFYMHISRELPKIETLDDYRPPVVTTVYSSDNKKIGEFFKERRFVIPVSEMPELLKNAFISAEDDRFYEHKGIDIVSIARAFVKNLKAGAIVQGGSTITQQVTKSFFLTPEKTYRRKLKEAILAYKIDKRFSKDEILFLYLNQIYLGSGAYGVEAAAETYFGKRAKDLDLAECAVLAGLPQAPSRYSPFRHPERAKDRQSYVLNRMVSEGYITAQQAADAKKKLPGIQERQNYFEDQVPYYAEYVRQYVEKKYGRDALYNEGLQIYAAVNVEMQKIARQAVEKGLRDLDKRQGYRGPIKHVENSDREAYLRELAEGYEKTPFENEKIVEGLVLDIDDRGKKVAVSFGGEKGTLPLENMRWARKPNPKVPSSSALIAKPSQALKAGDAIHVELLEKNDQSGIWTLALEQVPKAQSALLCMEAQTGHVIAMIGGRDYHESQFNRAIQSRRQPGSAFKPIVYAAALDKGYTPATVILDTAVVYKDANMTWKPKNYSAKFYGPTLFREALTHSRNLVTIKILKDIGVDYAIDYAKRLGIESHLEPNLSMGLGASGVSLLELVTAYSVFANQGYRFEPVFVTKVLDRNGKVLEEAGIQKRKVIEETTAYLMTSLLKSVVEDGTGRRVRALNRPAAGKTGTTNDQYDAWFMGYTPGYITGTWVGFDQEAPLGRAETGSKAASPIWLDFMSKILDGKPVRQFTEPMGLVYAKIDGETGLLPIAQSKKTYWEVFKEGTAPTEYTPKPETRSEYDNFFKNNL